MKKRLNVLSAGILVVVLILAACEKVVYPPVEKPSGVSYADDVQPIFDAKCVSCHGGGISPNLNPDVSYNELINKGYINVQDPPNSDLMTTLYGSHDSRATEEEKLLILSWIEEGAQNN